MALAPKKRTRGKQVVVPERLIEARTRLGLRQMDLAYHANLTQGRISALENGDAGDMTIAVFLALQRALRLKSADYLLGNTDTPEWKR
jgi:transcriptional regulator with XRE-family HTH domain